MKKNIMVIILVVVAILATGCGRESEVNLYKVNDQTVMIGVTEYHIFGSETKYFSPDLKEEYDPHRAIIAYTNERVCYECGRLLVDDCVFVSQGTGYHCAHDCEK